VEVTVGDQHIFAADTVPAVDDAVDDAVSPLHVKYQFFVIKPIIGPARQTAGKRGELGE